MMEKLFNDEQTAKVTTDYAEAVAAGAADTQGMLATTSHFHDQISNACLLRVV